MPEPSRRVPYRTWPGALLVLLAIGLYVGGLGYWDRHTPGAQPLPDGETVEVGQARFVPAEGWEMDVARSRAGRSLMLFKGGHRFQVTTLPWAGGPEGPMARQQRLMELGQGLRLEGDVADFVTSWGLQGVTFAYDGPNLSGRFWQMVDLDRRSLVQVNFYGSNDGLHEALAEARRMLDSMDLEASI